jgi:hypothetical protein
VAVKIIRLDVVVVVLPVFRTRVVRRINVYRVDFAAVREEERLQHVVVLAVDDRMVWLAAAAFDLPGRNKTWVDRVTELGDDDEVIDRRALGLRRFDSSCRLEDRAEFCDPLVSGTLDPDYSVQDAIHGRARLAACRQYADFIANANAPARQFDGFWRMALEVETKRATLSN